MATSRDSTRIYQITHHILGRAQVSGSSPVQTNTNFTDNIFMLPMIFKSPTFLFLRSGYLRGSQRTARRQRMARVDAKNGAHSMAT